LGSAWRCLGFFDEEADYSLIVITLDRDNNNFGFHEFFQITFFFVNQGSFVNLFRHMMTKGNWLWTVEILIWNVQHRFLAGGIDS
jgi:hypothetical protein